MKRTRGFTLIEILIVLAIIGILAALLFPVFKSARERANQTSCISNLHQIGLAVAMYRNEEKEFPSSLAFLLPSDAKLPNAVVSGEQQLVPNDNGTGYLKTMSVLFCPDDDEDSTVRSSYGEINIFPTRPTLVATDQFDYSRFVWNFFGYNDTGTAFFDAADAKGAMDLITPANPRLVNAAQPYDFKTNPIKYSMSNRFAPANTVVTRCIFHRTQTSDAADAITAPAGARDIILRVDGAAKSVDVSHFKVATDWDQ